MEFIDVRFTIQNNELDLFASYKAFSLTNAHHGMEDDAIYEEEIPQIYAAENEIEEEINTDSKDHEPWVNTKTTNKQLL